MPPWLVSPASSGSGFCPFEDLLFTFWSYLTFTYAQWLYYTPLMPLIALLPIRMAAE
jgi:hypothetical protein